MSARIVRLVISLVVFFSIPCAVSAQDAHDFTKNQIRTALVIGVGNYSKIDKLNNPANDAKDIGTSLSNLHFHPQVHTNDNAADLRKHIEEWASNIPRNCDIALFYFAGHGLQDKGENYIFPTDGTDISEVLLGRTTYKVSDILNRMKASGAKLNILILDACRLPPEPRAIKAGKFRKGLAAMNPTGNGTLICFSTEANKASSDGPANGHSQYTQALLEYLEVPGLPILKMLERVHDQVFYNKDIDQNPCIYSSVGEEFDFCLSPGNLTTKSNSVSNTVVSNTQPLLQSNSTSTAKDHLFKAAADSVTQFVNNEITKICQSSGGDITASGGPSRADIDNYVFMNHFALVAAMSATRIVVARVDLSLDGITLHFKLSSANKDWVQPENDLLARYEYLHNLDSVYTKDYSIYAIRWNEISQIINNFYEKRLPVLQKNGVLETPRRVSDVDTFTQNKISEFRSGGNTPSKMKENSDRKLFDALYQMFKSVATQIKDSIGRNFEYHEDDIDKDYNEHTFYYGIGIRSVDIPDKWLVPIFMGSIRNDSLYLQISTYANPRLSAWEENNGMPHEQKTEVALSQLNWEDINMQTRKFMAARLEILR